MRKDLAFGERSRVEMGPPLQEGTDHSAARQAKCCAVRRGNLLERLSAKQARSIGGNSSWGAGPREVELPRTYCQARNDTRPDPGSLTTTMLCGGAFTRSR